MKPHDYLVKLKKSQTFTDFMKEDPNAYLCSLFFIRDFEEKVNDTQVDFYSPKSKKIVSFKVDKKVERVALDKKAENLKHEKFVPKRINEKTNLDIDKLKDVLLDEMHNRGITDDIKKMLIIFHNLDERDVWNSTCFLRGMGLLQAHVEDKSESVLFMEKKSFFDMIRFIGKGDMEAAVGKKNDILAAGDKNLGIEAVSGNKVDIKIVNDEKDAVKAAKDKKGNIAAVVDKKEAKKK
ncbi:MAG: hypothetical protein AABW50_00945 [Nanoarchaeota archaeon]